MIVNIHKRPDGTILVSACDNDLIGKLFEEGAKLLDLTGPFYSGKDLDENAAGDVLRNADYINVVGEKSVALAIKEGLIDADRVLTVQGIPHAEAILLQD